MKRVWVTGGSSGIGLATVQSFLAADYEVISIARRPCPVRHEALRSVETDLLDPNATREAFESLGAEAPATTVVHCAGVIREKPIEQTDIGDITDLANLHIGAACSLLKANLAAMKAASFGRIILISTRAVLGLAKRTAYASTKAGMLGLTRTWALELASFGITANAVAPGPIAETEMFHSIIPVGSEKMASAARQIPVGRFGTPADVARAVLFFADDRSSFITGQTLFVCGGTSVGSIVY
jgi:3-oxoacyl-[acyl-carrier protein] reductase